MEEGGEHLSFGGRVEKVDVEEVELGINATGDRMYWKAVIEDHREGAEAWYTDGSKLEDGKVGAG